MTPLPPEGCCVLASIAVIDGVMVEDARIDVDADGIIRRAGPRLAISEAVPAIVRDYGSALLVPGFVNAHSHAFQRALRGATHHRVHGESDFWSWREAMYRVANTLDPEGVHAITRRAFQEMLAAGITCVGEFHYLHHAPDGRPYADPNELSWQVVRAAADVGIRLVLLDVYYERAGPGLPPRPEQRRFCDGDVDRYLARLEALRAADVAVAVTPHSVRAVRADAIQQLAAFAHAHALPMHAHVSEQPRENEECRAEHGCSPLALFERVGALARPRSFTAVHATHVDEADRIRLARASVCMCPSTEADLGDGIGVAADLLARGCNVALGSDGNAIIDLVQEARLMEMHERLSARGRIRFATPARPLPLALLHAATEAGAVALGRGDVLGRLAIGRPLDAVVFDLRDPFFAEVAPEHALAALLTAGTAAAIRHVLVNGVEVV